MIDYKDDKFSEILGDKLRSVEDVPPVGMFERIEQTLHAMEVAKEPKKIVPLWNRPFVRGVAAALVAAMLTLVVVVALRDNAPVEMEIMAEQIVEELNEEPLLPISEATPKTEQVATITTRLVASTPVTKAAAIAPEESVAMEREETEPIEEQLVAENAEENTEQAQQTTKRESTRSKRIGSSRQNQQELEEYWRTAMSGKEQPKGTLRPIEVGFYAQNVGFNYGHIVLNNLANGPMVTKEQNETTGGNYFSPTLVQQNPSSNLEHFMPVTVGVTVSYSLSDWLSVNSGLVYTNIYSKSNTEGSMSHYSRKRTLDYLGVPVALALHFAEFNRWSLYGRVGGTVELCINANDKSYMDGEFVQKYDLEVPPLTFSLDAAVGATYALWGNIGLFGEVGCTYWRAPVGYVANYRTVHPLGFSTRFGLHFAFN